MQGVQGGVRVPVPTEDSMRDHNHTPQAPYHREHPNIPLSMTAADSAPYTAASSFSPWGGDDLEECEEEPCAWS